MLRLRSARLPWGLAIVCCAVAPGAAAAADQPVSPTTGHAPASAFTTVVTERRALAGVAAQSIDRDQLERQGALGAIDALERTAAIQASNGSRGERIYQLRGFDQRQTLVLLDGAPLEVPYDGQVDLGWIPAAALDQVLVLKGPVAATYGANGLGGAVNLVTRWPGAGPLASAAVEVAPDELRLSASHALSSGPLGWTVWGGDQQRAGFELSERFKPVSEQGSGRRRNSDQRLTNGGGSVGWQIDPQQRLRASALGVDGERGVPPSTVDPTPRYWRFSSWRALAASLGHEVQLDPRWRLEQMWFAQRFDNLIDAFDDASYSTQQSSDAMHSWYHDATIGGRARLEYRLNGGARSLIARADLSAQRESHRKEEGGALGTEYARLLLVAAPGLDVAWSPRWQASASVQVDAEVPEPRIATTPHPAASVGPVLALQHQLLPGLALRGALARRTRFASLKERHATGLGDRLANPDLAAESAWHFELDAMWRPARWLSLDAAAYDAEVSDLIELVQLGGGSEQMRNTGSVRLAGVEAAARLRPLPAVELSASYLGLHARRTSGGEQRMEYRPLHRGVVAASWQPIEQVALWSLLRVVGPQDFVDPFTLRWMRLGAYTVLDARAEGTLRDGVQVWLRATNLLDSNYQTQYGYPDPGRQVWIGMKLELD